MKALKKEAVSRVPESEEDLAEENNHYLMEGGEPLKAALAA